MTHTPMTAENMKAKMDNSEIKTAQRTVNKKDIIRTRNVIELLYDQAELDYDVDAFGHALDKVTLLLGEY